MISHIDVDEVVGLGEKLEYLATLFRRFNFPNKPHHGSSSSERDYLDSVLRLYGLNSGLLDHVAQESLDEWNLQVDMGQEEESDDYYLNEFIRRVNAAIDETTEAMFPEFSASQLALTQTEEEEQGRGPGRDFDRVTSFSTTLNGSPIFSGLTNDRSDGSALTSPISSMNRLILESPQQRAITFLERLQLPEPLQPQLAQLPNVPPVTLPPSVNSNGQPYVYGVLPFAIDWEVWRVDCHHSLDLATACEWQETLQPHVESPKIFWECLRQRAESVAGTLVKKIRMPETSSARAWELIHMKGWTHGQVHFTMTLDVFSNGKYKCIPQPMVVSSSRRAYRKFGADRFVALSVDKSKLRTNEARMKRFLQQPLAICGRSYRVFFVKIKKGSKDSFTVHAFATDGEGLAGREVTMDMLLEWTLSLNNNCTSVAPKLWSRISLSLSSTKPSVIFTHDQIRLVRDIVSPSGQCMTDGCARASPAVFREIWLSGILANKETPTAVQGRIGAAKGVWFVDPLSDPHSEEKWVEIRPSQLKFLYDPITSQDPMLRTLDICKTSGSSFGDTINNQFIGILSYCGVPTDVFKNLLEQDLQANLGVVNDYLDNPIALRDWIAQLGSIYSIRCLGVEDYTDAQTGDSARNEPRCITYNPAGVPTMLEEVTVSLLEAGFLPKTSRILRDKLKMVVTRAREKNYEKIHISIAKSTTMICIADDLGILEENEVSIRFGKPFRDEETGRNRYYIQGDVLVARNPALLPTDIQKVQAVVYPQLEHLTDVIVFSTKGLKSKVSLLAGGDFDGDLIWICWEEQLVNAFRNADERYAEEPPNLVNDYFIADNRPVCEIAGEGLNLIPQKFINYGMETSLVESDLGVCTVRHRDVVYDRGFDHPQAILLAHLAARLVDAPKAGLTLKQNEWIPLLKQLRTNIPEYVKPKGERRNLDSDHVMDVLVFQVIPQFLERVLISYCDRVGGDARIPIDPDIKGFYEIIKTAHPKMVASLKEKLTFLNSEWTTKFNKIKNEQDQAREDVTCSPRKRQKTTATKDSQSAFNEICLKYQRLRIDEDYGTLMTELNEFVPTPIRFSEQIKAATAYCLKENSLWMTEEPSHFAWSCGGFAALCKIKADAVMARYPSSLPPRNIIEQMYISLKPNSAFTLVEKGGIEMNRI